MSKFKKLIKGLNSKGFLSNKQRGIGNKKTKGKRGVISKFPIPK